MKYLLIACCTLIILSCTDHKGLYQPVDPIEYAQSFKNRTDINVNINSKFDGTVYSIYYQYPYEEGSLVKEPVLIGKTPIQTTLEVPNDVKKLYIIGDGQMLEHDVQDISLMNGAMTKAAEKNNLSEAVLNAINSQYFPEATNNVRGENLFKCTDLVIAETESTGDFNQAEVWMTFISDGGSRSGGLYGKCWFYTYPSEKQDKLEKKDCTFYGLVNGEIQKIKLSDIEARNNYIFHTQEEIKNGISSYKKYKLGTFDKGLSIGFIYYGNSEIQYTTPRLNQMIGNYTLKYSDKKDSIKIENKYVASGFIRHILVDNFEGNILGLENRSVTESKYDGDYNDMLCLLESNPLALQPSEPIDPPAIDEYKVREGIYLFEDNYPNKGDFDFNDAVIQYKIIDYYNTSNGAKQITAKVLAKGAVFNNEFGFRVNNEYTPFLKNIQGYSNVHEEDVYKDLNLTASYSVYTKNAIEPYLNNGQGYIHDENFNTGDYPYVLEIPISDPNDPNWKYHWCLEGENLDNCYYFLKSKDGGKRSKDWYKAYKEGAKVFKW